MKKVWVVEQGTYSDYRVVGVFSTKANAKLVMDAINAARDGSYDEATIDQWSLNPAVFELRKGYRQFIVLMLKDGSLEGEVREWDVSGYLIAGEVRVWERTKAPAYKGKGIPDALQATVWARDKKHAVKIVNEHRARLIASGEFK